jgi:hypothetical protein
MPIFNHKTKGRVLFIHIPKAAGSSIEKWLKDAGYELDKINHWSGHNHQHAPREVYETWGNFDYKFTIVRNPMDRFISALGFRTIQKGDANRIACDVLKKYKKGILTLDWGNHLQPQVDFLSDDVEIFKFEEDFFPQLSKILDIPEPFPHENKTRTEVSISDLSEEARQEIQQLYTEDYKVLGYNIEPPKRIPDATSPNEGE